MKTFLLIGAILHCVLLAAQVPKGLSVAAGINQAGFNSDAFPSDPAMGYQFGVAYNWGYHEAFNYQIEILRTKSSFNAAYISGAGTGNGKMSFAGTDVLFNFNYYLFLPEEDVIYAGLSGGAYTSFSNGWDTESGEIGEDRLYGGIIPATHFDNVSKFNAGLSIGAIGGFNDFKLAIRYSFGLTNAIGQVEDNNYDEFNSYQGGYYKGRLNSLTVTLYYKIL